MFDAPRRVFMSCKSISQTCTLGLRQTPDLVLGQRMIVSRFLVSRNPLEKDSLGEVSSALPSTIESWQHIIVIV